MGVEARFQAIPEDCDLLKRARQDREIAENMQGFNRIARGIYGPPHLIQKDPSFMEFIDAVKILIQAHPGLVDRYYYAGGRTWDMIIYLLSPERRAGNFENDQSLIRKAIWGNERLHSEATAGQGIPIGFVPTNEVRTISDFLETMTLEGFHEHYDPPRMSEWGVYKMHATDDERTIQFIWEEFCGMRDVYRQAALHNEAMITIID